MTGDQPVPGTQMNQRKITPSKSKEELDDVAREEALVAELKADCAALTEMRARQDVIIGALNGQLQQQSAAISRLGDSLTLANVMISRLLDPTDG